jgi:Fe-S-cluster containining protein
LVRALRELYGNLDVQVAEHIKNQKVTCKKGCSHCCKLLTTIAMTEGILLADHVLRNMDWRKMMPKIVELAKEHSYDGINLYNFFSKKLSCIFLQDDQTCGVYDIRPACCRFHYVVSDPDLCSPDRPGSVTATVDLRLAEEPVWKMNIAAFGHPVMAPLPVMLLFCMVGLSDGTVLQDELEAACEGIPTPDEWFVKYGMSVVASELSGNLGKVSDEELVQIRSGT